MEDFVAQLETILAGELPGPAAQNNMSPELRLGEEHARYQNAAVLILLYQKNEEICTVLMKRPEYTGAHSNQVSFPGGKFEKNDRDLHMTALRETREELGIDDRRIRVLGVLSRLEIPVSGIEVLPVIGYDPGSPRFNPDPAEVRYLIETPVSDLLDPSIRQEGIRTVLCKMIRVPYYNIRGNQVWGATAMILSEFLEIIRKIVPGPQR